MKIEIIPLMDLSTNKTNDRHGELADESSAIEWLLTHRADHMRNLTKDIVGEGGIYEPPLVHQDNSSYVVYDGNRRVTCLKLLYAPQHAPSREWQKFFLDQRNRWKGNFLDVIPCQVETDLDRIDEILYRRHTGGQSGIGQSQWDAEAKSNFVKRTGKKTPVNLAEEIESKLKESGHLKQLAKVPRSNLNRLLSSESIRNRVGISVNKQHVEITHNEFKVFNALSRIANDLITKSIVLGDIWSNQDKKRYLDRLETEGVLPTATDALTTNKKLKTLKPINKNSDKKTGRDEKLKPKARKTLIRPEDGNGLVSQGHTKRAMDIWNELQFHLKFEEHNNAISVLFRVLLEFSIENYIDRIETPKIKDKDNLAQKFRKVLDHMLETGAIEKKYYEGLTKFQQTEHLISANTMNKYVHHKSFFPSDIHLKSMWDTLSHYIEICLSK